VRVECEACRALVVARFALDGADVCATCPACRHVMRIAAASHELQAPDPAPLTASPGAPACPKCGALLGDAAACPACGLAVARMAAYVDARDAAVSPAVREAWTRATCAWDDAARHDELLQQAAAHDAYAWAAGRYRTRGGDAIARRQLDRLRRAAEATLLASATARRDVTVRPYRATRRVLAILLATIAAGAVYATLVRGPVPPASVRPGPGRLPALERPPPPATIK